MGTISHRIAQSSLPQLTSFLARQTQNQEHTSTMEQRRPPEYIIEVFADPSSVKDVVRGYKLIQPHHIYRYPTHNILPPILPFAKTDDARYPRPDAAVRGRC